MSKTVRQFEPQDAVAPEVGSPSEVAELLDRELAWVLAAEESAGTFLRGAPPEPHRLRELVAGVEPADRPRAVRVLGTAWAPLQADAVAPLMKDPAPAVRTAAVEVVEGSDGATAMLHERLRDDLAAEVRVAAIGALARAHEPDQLSALAVAVADPDARVRASAFEALPAARSAAAATAVLAGTRDEHGDVRRAAYRCLAAMPSWVLWEALDACARPEELYSVLAEASAERVETLALARAGSPEPAHRVSSVKLASRSATPACREWTLAALRDPAAAVRRAAARQLSGRSDAVAHLVRTLKADPDPTVRREAALALTRGDGDDALLALMGALHDPDASVRHVAVEALPARCSPGLARRVAAELTAANTGSVGQVLLAMGAVGEEALTAALIGGPEERSAAAAAVLRGTDVLGRLFERLTSLDPPTRLGAVDGLGALGGPEAVEGLISALSDAVPENRARAVFHLGRLADRRGARALESVAQCDPVLHVARAARNASGVIRARAEETANTPANGRSAGHPHHVDL